MTSARMPTSETATVVSDARGRLLAELAAGPARRGYGIAYDLLGNRAEAEEAVQEALARACENIAELRDDVAAPAWFLRIVTTVCLRNLRRRKLWRATFGRFTRAATSDANTIDTLELLGDDATLDDDTGLPAGFGGRRTMAPNKAIENRQELLALLRNLDGLAAQQRAALVLRYGQDLPVAEVAQLLGVELATAKTHLVRGLAKLRELMEEHR